MKDLSKIEIINDYFINYAEVIYLKTDHYGYIIESNDFTKRIFNQELVKKNIKEIINFSDKNTNFNIYAEKDEIISLTCPVFNDTPETFLFKFYKINENFIIFGCYDSKEIISDKKHTNKFKKDILLLNKYIQSANIEIKKLNKLKNKSYPIMAQEIKNNLFAIQINTDMLLNELENRIDHNERNYFDSIKTTVSILKNIIINFINSYDNITEPLNLEYKISDINTFISDTLSVSENIAKNYKIKFIININKDIDKINADADKLALALKNITINAIQHSKPESEIYIDIIKKENEILFSIKDSGTGISEDYKEKIFKPLSENDANDENKKNGFGLLIAKTIIESHKGKIWFESELDKGSIFYFTIPYYEEAKE